VEVGQDVMFDQVMDGALAVFACLLFNGHVDGFTRKGESASSRIKN
jgi:hypothetical protein